MKIEKIHSCRPTGDYLTGEIVTENGAQYFIGDWVFTATAWREEWRTSRRVKIRNGAIRFTSSSNTITFLIPGCRSKFYEVKNYRHAMDGWIGRAWVDKTEKVTIKGKEIIVYHFNKKIVGVWYINNNCGSYNKDFIGTAEEYVEKDPFSKIN